MYKSSYGVEIFRKQAFSDKVLCDRIVNEWFNLPKTHPDDIDLFFTLVSSRVIATNFPRTTDGLFIALSVAIEVYVDYNIEKGQLSYSLDANAVYFSVNDLLSNFFSLFKNIEIGYVLDGFVRNVIYTQNNNIEDVNSTFFINTCTSNCIQYAKNYADNYYNKMKIQGLIG